MIGLAIFAWLFAESAEPIQWLKPKLKITPDTMAGRLFYCSLCFGFWLFLVASLLIDGLQYTAFIDACIGAALSEGVSRLSKYTTTL